MKRSSSFVARRFLPGHAALLVVLAGCGSSRTGFVAGRVTVAGQPAPAGVVIQFDPVVAKDLGESIGTVGEDGRYVAINSATGEQGVAIGMCVARLVENEASTDLPQREGQQPRPRYDPRQFKEVARFEVKAGANTMDLELVPASQ